MRKLPASLWLSPCSPVGGCLALRDQPRSGAIHAPAGHIWAHAELKRDFLGGSALTGERFGSLEGDQQLASKFSRLVFLVSVSYSAPALADNGGSEAVLPQNGREFMAHGRSAPHEGVRIVLYDHGAVTKQDQHPREDIGLGQHEMLSHGAIELSAPRWCAAR